MESPSGRSDKGWTIFTIYSEGLCLLHYILSTCEQYNSNKNVINYSYQTCGFVYLFFNFFFAISRRCLSDTLIRMMHPGLLRAATYVVVSLMRSSQMIVFFERHIVSARRFMYSVVTVCVRKRILRLNVTVFPLQRSFQALTRVLHTGQSR